MRRLNNDGHVGAEKLAAIKEVLVGSQAGKCNAAIEGFEDKFTDGSNVLEYDISRLEKQYLGRLSGKSNSKIPCFVEQIEVATCFRSKSSSEESKSDPFVCDMFIKALADCTDKTITSKNAKTSQ